MAKFIYEHQGERYEVEAVSQEEADNKMYQAFGGQEDNDEASWGETIGAGVQGLANTLTLGWNDEIEAGLQSATGLGGEFGEYDKNLKAVRDRIAQNSEAAPGAELAGQIGGVLAPTGMAANSLRMASQKGLGALGTQVAKNAGIGAVAGSTMRAGESEKSGLDRLDDINPGVDAGLGVIGGAIGAKLGRVLSKKNDKVLRKERKQRAQDVANKAKATAKAEVEGLGAGSLARVAQAGSQDLSTALPLTGNRRITKKFQKDIAAMANRGDATNEELRKLRKSADNLMYNKTGGTLKAAPNKGDVAATKKLQSMLDVEQAVRNPQSYAKTINARDAGHRMKTSERIQKRLGKMTSVDQLRGAMKDPKFTHGMPKEVRDVIEEELREGTTMQRIMQLIGRLTRLSPMSMAYQAYRHPGIGAGNLGAMLSSRAVTSGKLNKVMEKLDDAALDKLSKREVHDTKYTNMFGAGYGTGLLAGQ